MKLRGAQWNPLAALLGLTWLLCVSCAVGPRYSRPAPAEMPADYREALPAGWKEAQPDEGRIRGKWWELFNEPDLSALEEMVTLSNQNVLAAEAQFREARDAVKVSRAALFPSLSVAPSILSSRAAAGGSSIGSTSGTPVNGAAIRTSYDLPVDFSYQADIWGGIRSGVKSNAAAAQATAAQLENARLTYQAELAQDYFQLRTARSDEELLDRTVKSYEESLDLTRKRFTSGVVSGSDVAQAETQFYGAQTDLIDLQIERSQLEHAIAVLTGNADVDVPSSPLSDTPPPAIPVGVPSDLLEWRPDIAAAEREMAAANEQVGIARVAYYPSLNITASSGLSASSLAQWLAWPSRFWTVGTSALETLFDAGKRQALTDQARAHYDETVANYRETVLTGFAQVEDRLAELRVLENETTSEAARVDAAERTLQIANAQYQAGTADYLQVITAQAAALQAEKAAVDLRSRRMVASVLLIEALGGGWNVAALPSVQAMQGTR